MNELALFAGAGGGILGGKRLGWRTVCAVEFDPYAASVLAARQNDGLLPPFPIWDDVRTFDGLPLRGAVDVVSGGFPCQDISVAGGGAGIDGERSGLWGEMARIVGEVRPRFVFVENSPALTSRGLGTVLGDLAALGYAAEWGVLGASDVGAPHRRKRIWIVAYSPGHAGNQRWTEPTGQQRPAGIADGGHDVAHTELPERRQEREACNGLAGEVRIQQREEGAGGPGRRGEDVADTQGVCCWPGLCEDGQEQDRHQPCDCGGAVSDPNSVRELQPERCQQEQWRWSGDFCEDLPDSDPEHVHDSGLRAGEIPQQQAATVSGVLPDTDSQRFTGRRTELSGNAEPLHEDKKRDWWATEPDVGRVAHGVAARMDRLKAVGNGQVPECAAEAFCRLMDRIRKFSIETVE